MERKETELEQSRAGSARNTTESQKQRAVSPFRLPKYGVNGSMKPETCQRPNDDRISEVTECILLFYHKSIKNRKERDNHSETARVISGLHFLSQLNPNFYF